MAGSDLVHVGPLRLLLLLERRSCENFEDAGVLDVAETGARVLVHGAGAHHGRNVWAR